MLMSSHNTLVSRLHVFIHVSHASKDVNAWLSRRTSANPASASPR
jgi:hypothetical protein